MVLRRASFQHALRILATYANRAIGRSDRNRWSTTQHLSSDWDQRTIDIARMIPPGSSVLELGAGRMVLRSHLSAGCSYTPSDICDRGPGTLVCDLNATQLPKFPKHDVVVLGGVLEYIHDVPRLIRNLSDCCDTIITSYAVLAQNTPKALLKRRALGWFNDYSSDELSAVFHLHNYLCHEERDVINNQKLYKFVRGTDDSAIKHHSRHIAET